MAVHRQLHLVAHFICGRPTLQFESSILCTAINIFNSDSNG